MTCYHADHVADGRLIATVHHPRERDESDGQVRCGYAVQDRCVSTTREAGMSAVTSRYQAEQTHANGRVPPGPYVDEGERQRRRKERESQDGRKELIDNR
jgi:hypothetical protein